MFILYQNIDYMKHKFSKPIFWFTFLVAGMLTNGSQLHAQTTVSNTATADEQAIRAIVAQGNEGKPMPYTDDRIFVSGAFPKPLIGMKLNAEDQQRSDNMKTERLNFTSRFRIERLVVAQAGDMAYEFGYGDLAWDTPEKKHVAIESSYVRVWRKMQGSWKVDLSFARPNETPVPR